MLVDVAEVGRIIEASVRPVAVGSDYRPAAVFVLLTQREQTNMLLIRRADRGDPWSNHIAFPGGHIDPSDADALEAAYRETREEVGIERRAVSYLADLGHFQTHHLKVDLHAFVGLWSGQGPLRVNPAEVAQVIEVPVGELLRQHRASGFAVRSADQLGDRLVYRFADMTIWGVTARIIYHLLNLIAPLHSAAVRRQA